MHGTDHSTSLHVLSIQTPVLGNRTVGLMMRDHFQESDRTRWDTFWMDDERELGVRIVARLLNWRFPMKAVSTRNLDGGRFRAELASGILGRRLAVRKLRQRRPDVMHFHTHVPAFCAVGLMRQVPTVISTDITMAQAVAEHVSSRYRWTFGPNFALERRCFHAARRIVVWSEWTKREALRAYPFLKDRVVVWYPGVDLARVDVHSAPLDNARPRILFIGGEFERKGGPDLLDVFVQRLADRAELDLVTNAQLTISHPAVHVHRGVEAYSPRWRSLLARASLFVLPTHAEAFGLAYIEALAAGLPVIGTRIGAVPELVHETETGYLIAPGDRRALANAILKLLENPERGRRMGQTARAIAASRFDSRRNLEVFEDIVIEAAAEGPPAR